jgi:hypothetical protein
MTLVGRDFPPGPEAEILLDERPIFNATIGKSGELRVELAAPAELGLHGLKVRDARTGEVIDGMMFIVRHPDEPLNERGGGKSPEQKLEQKFRKP